MKDAHAITLPAISNCPFPQPCSLRLISTALKSPTVQYDNIASLQDASHQPQPSPRLAPCRIADVAAARCVPYRRRQMPRCLSERSYVRRVDAPSDDGGGVGLVNVQARIIRPSVDLLEAVKMEEDQRLLIDIHAAAIGRNRVIRQVPG